MKPDWPLKLTDTAWLFWEAYKSRNKWRINCTINFHGNVQEMNTPFDKALEDLEQEEYFTKKALLNKLAEITGDNNGKR